MIRTIHEGNDTIWQVQDGHPFVSRLTIHDDMGLAIDDLIPVRDLSDGQLALLFPGAMPGREGKA